MKRFLITFVALALFISFGEAFANKKYGAPLTVKSITKVSDILAKPDNFAGKTVKVQGTIISVCKKRGCWIEIAGQNKGESIKVKVNDGEIVFPADCSGKTAIVQGVVEKIYVDAEKSEAKGEHECKSDEGKVVWRIKGQGAEIIGG